LYARRHQCHLSHVTADGRTESGTLKLAAWHPHSTGLLEQTLVNLLIIHKETKLDQAVKNELTFHTPPPKKKKKKKKD